MTLTLASAVVVSDTGVKVSYEAPATGSDNRLKDAADNEVDGLHGRGGDERDAGHGEADGDFGCGGR